MTNDDLADILRSALSGTQLNTGFNIRRIMEHPGESAYFFNLASSHSVANVVSIGLLNNGINPDGTPFEKAELRAAYSDAQIEAMMSSIRSTFEAHHITFIPLKGLVLKQFCPESSMRTCGDVDILVKEEQVEDAVNLLVKECGCKVESYNYHDVALVTPDEQTVELHFSVLYDIEKLDAVLSHVWDYTEPIAGKCEMKLTDGFFLFFIFAHMFHHFVTGGCGIRFFMDLWVIKYRMGIEYENGAKEFCIKAGIDKFATIAIQLSKVWFGGGYEHTELTQAMEEYVLSGGTFGSAENSVVASGAVRQTDRLQYNLKRMLLPYSKLKLINPEMKGYQFPFYEVKRWGELLNRGMSRRREMSGKSVSAEKREKIQMLMQHLEIY